MRYLLIGMLALAGCATTGIETQSMMDALNAWALRSGYQIIVPECADVEVRAPVMADGSIEALEELLRGTEMGYWRVNDKTVAIHCFETNADLRGRLLD